MKVKSCKRSIHQKKKNHSSIIKLQQQEELLSIQSFNFSMRTIIEDCLVNIEQRAQQLMKFSSTINDDNFF